MYVTLGQRRKARKGFLDFRSKVRRLAGTGGSGNTPGRHILAGQPEAMGTGASRKPAGSLADHGQGEMLTVLCHLPKAGCPS